MRKSIFAVVSAAIALALLTTGCAKNDPTTPMLPTKIAEDTVNPFKAPQGEEFMPSSLGHGPASPKLDANGNRLPLKFTGGEFRLDYTVKADGKAKNVGFLVFLDGIPQAYKIDASDAPYEFMHTFNLKEDGKETPFSFIFTPVTGKTGDTLMLTVVSIYNPSFIPDMVNSVSYGMYHSTLPMEFQLNFERDADTLDNLFLPQKVSLQNTIVNKEPITSEFLATLGGGLSGEISLEDLNTRTFCRLLYNSENQMDNLKIEDGKTLQLGLTICGVPGATYKTTFYANHQPLSTVDGTAFTTTLDKGDMSVIKTQVDVSALDDFSTFYAVSVPINPADFPNAVITLEKSLSILIYK